MELNPTAPRGQLQQLLALNAMHGNVCVQRFPVLGERAKAAFTAMIMPQDQTAFRHVEVEFGVNPIWLLTACEKPSDPSCLELAGKVAAWTIRNMQDRKDFFYYRQYPFVIAKIPMLHWGKPRCSRRWPIFSDDFKSESARQRILAHSQQGKLPLTATVVMACEQKTPFTVRSKSDT